MYFNKIIFAAALALLGFSGFASASYRVRPAYAVPQENSEAAADAITDIAAAKASASKLDNINWDVVNRYGFEIGKPLLTKNVGSVTSLYAALAPKSTFVGTIDAGFYKDSYGRISFRGPTDVGVLVV